MATLLQTMNQERAARMERLRLTVREELRSALRDILPGVPVTGSLTQAGRFTDGSDVDLGLAAEPPSSLVYQLIAQARLLGGAEGRLEACAYEFAFIATALTRGPQTNPRWLRD
jgi:hypothetical protein